MSTLSVDRVQRWTDVDVRNEPGRPEDAPLEISYEGAPITRQDLRAMCGQHTKLCADRNRLRFVLAQILEAPALDLGGRTREDLLDVLRITDPDTVPASEPEPAGACEQRTAGPEPGQNEFLKASIGDPGNRSDPSPVLPGHASGERGARLLVEEGFISYTLRDVQVLLDRIDRLAAACDRIWAVVGLRREALKALGRDPYRDPIAQALSAALTDAPAPDRLEVARAGTEVLNAGERLRKRAEIQGRGHTPPSHWDFAADVDTVLDHGWWLQRRCEQLTRRLASLNATAPGLAPTPEAGLGHLATSSAAQAVETSPEPHIWTGPDGTAYDLRRTWVDPQGRCWTYSVRHTAAVGEPCLSTESGDFGSMRWLTSIAGPLTPAEERE